MKTMLAVIILLFAIYTAIADYCKFKDALGYPCKSQDRVTTVAKTECPLTIEQYPPNIVTPKLEMRS